MNASVGVVPAGDKRVIAINGACRHRNGMKRCAFPGVLLLIVAVLLPAGCASKGSSYAYRQYLRKQGHALTRQQQREFKERSKIPEAETSDRWNVTTELGAVETQ